MKPEYLAKAVLTTSVPLNSMATVKVGQLAPATVVSAAKPTASKIKPTLAQSVSANIRHLPTVRPALTTKLEQVRWINPELASAISSIRPTERGVPRSAITVPLSLTAKVSDETVFEDATDARKKNYLPRYRLVEQNQQVQMSLAAVEQGWTLSIELEKFPASALETVARNATELQHEVSICLQHRLMAGDNSGGQKEWIFEPPVVSGSGIRAALNITQALELSLLFQVLTQANYDATLMVQRTIKVGIPALTNASPTALQQAKWLNSLLPTEHNNEGAISNSSGTLRGTWTFDLDTGVESGENSDIWWQQKTKTSRFMAPRGRAELAYLGVVDFDSITVHTLQKQKYSKTPINGSLSTYSPIKPFPRPIRDLRPLNKNRVNQLKNNSVNQLEHNNVNQLRNSHVFAVKTNRGNYAKVQVVKYGYDLTIRWVTYKPSQASEPLFHEVTRVVAQPLSPQPFVFPQTLYPYIYQGITASTGQTLEPRRWTFKWQDQDHSYYQDPVRADIIYYLPDAFKLVRRPESPHYPMVSISFIPADKPEDTRVTIAYWAFPVVENERLNAAAQALNAAGVLGNLLFQSMIADNPRLFLKLPQSDGSVKRQEFPDIPVELRTGFSDFLTLPMQAFLSIYEALFSKLTQVFQGDVQVDFSGNQPAEIVPFQAHMGDLVGEILDYQQTVDAVTGRVQVTLTNAIESPIQIDRLVTTFDKDGTQVPGVASDLSPALPVKLKAGESLICVIAPSEPIEPDALTSLKFDLSHLKVVPDRDAIFTAMLSPDSPASYSRFIRVDVRKAVFGDRIADINIDFQKGGTLTFNYERFSQTQSDLLSDEAPLFFPIRDLINRVADSGEYGFRTIVMLKDGTKVEDPADQWRTDSAEVLSISNSELPALPAA